MINMIYILIGSLILSVIDLVMYIYIYFKEIEEHETRFELEVFLKIIGFCLLPFFNILILCFFAYNFVKETIDKNNINDKVTEWIRGEKDNG
jgi:hypothetical protein